MLTVGGELPLADSSSLDAVAVKISSAGAIVWAWRTNILNSNEVCSGMAELPAGGGVLVADLEAADIMASRERRIALAPAAVRRAPEIDLNHDKVPSVRVRAENLQGLVRNAVDVPVDTHDRCGEEVLFV